MVAVKDRLNGSRNPLAHLHQPDITLEKVLSSQMLWDPIRFDETCPSSDGACALVIGDEQIADARWPTVIRSPGSTPPRCAPNRWPTPAATRSTRKPAATPPPLEGGGHQPDRRDRRRRDLCAVLLVRADVAGEPRVRARGRGLETHRGGRDRDRRPMPVNPSGGVLSSNPIGASGMIRFAEAAIQVMGKAGDHQVQDARKALGHAYGGGSQYYSMWVVSPTSPRSDEVHLQHRDESHRSVDRTRQDRRGSRLRLDRAAGFAVLHGEAVDGLPVHPDGSRMWNADTRGSIR